MIEMPGPTSLRTARCHIRPLHEEDVGALVKGVLGSWDHLDRWVGVGPRLATPELAAAEVHRLTAMWHNGANFVLGVFAMNGELIGGTGFHPRDGNLGKGTTETGMWIVQPCSGQGYATEVLTAMLQWGLTDWPWERIEWRCESTNLASVAVAEKAGMTLDGVLRSSTVDRRGERCDTQVFSMLRRELS